MLGTSFGVTSAFDPSRRSDCHRWQYKPATIPARPKPAGTTQHIFARAAAF